MDHGGRPAPERGEVREGILRRHRHRPSREIQPAVVVLNLSAAGILRWLRPGHSPSQDAGRRQNVPASLSERQFQWGVRQSQPIARPPLVREGAQGELTTTKSIRAPPAGCPRTDPGPLRTSSQPSQAPVLAPVEISQRLAAHLSPHPRPPPANSISSILSPSIHPAAAFLSNSSSLHHHHLTQPPPACDTMMATSAP